MLQTIAGAPEDMGKIGTLTLSAAGGSLSGKQLAIYCVSSLQNVLSL